MAGATCIECGAPVIWRVHEGQRIPLDAHEAMKGEHRFADTPDGLVPVRSKADVMAHADHRFTCPARTPIP
jgi:hypothetical protein